MRSTARFEIRRAADQHRTLAAELQGHRDEVLGRGGHHATTHRGGAGEQQMIERQVGECLGHVGTAGHHGHLRRVEVFAHQLPHESAQRRRQFGRLDHAAITRGEDPRQRAEGERDRKVPGAYDADDAERLIRDLGAHSGRACRQADALRFRSHPAPQVAARMFERHDRGQYIREPRQRRGPAAEVSGNRVADLRLMRDQQVDRAIQAIRTHPRGGYTFGPECRPLDLEQCPGIVRCIHGAFRMPPDMPRRRAECSGR